jgi:hypothetical protein
MAFRYLAPLSPGMLTVRSHMKPMYLTEWEKGMFLDSS